ncbi:MAG: hypothetical protein FWF46_01795 [Oscillospiraceae bacterium]|nr:hypothetical protein [Oscillospiraceae bacterium]
MFEARNEKSYGYNTVTGKILHVDGDRKYSTKANLYYIKAGLNAIVKNIPEKTQPFIIQDLIKIYKPDMLVITGHDRMLKKDEDFYNIYNYKNSLNFVKTVERARELVPSLDELVIFAGACQSFFEALIESGANFASSPGRILIDFMDPIIVAEKIVTTPETRYVTIHDIVPEIREGRIGIGGTRGRGKKKIYFRSYS